MALYHYRESGLDNVWLLNGFERHKTSEGSAMSFKNIDGLHQTIARALIAKSSRLTAKEFRFLRTELDLSQKALGDVIGASEQAVARWERGITPVPAAEDRLLRALYREHADGNAKLWEMASALGARDDSQELRLKLRHGRQAWKMAA
ncbi:MAG: helix-turn-helix domain-containing protein [Rhodospirillaceae bacterium]|nr:helix-turn-helix domain-containing protein [Rhodospirillaceae bacterium]